MNSITLKRSKNRLLEFIKYDFNYLKSPLVFIVFCSIKLLELTKNYKRAFELASSAYRTGWAGSYTLGLHLASKYFDLNSEIGSQVSREFINEVKSEERTQKFFDNPAEMLDGIINILKLPSDGEKGALLLNYSYYFPLFLKFFDVNAIQKEYNIILEPSWAGFCEINILSYSLLDEPVFLQTYENRDLKFISNLSTKLVPIEVGPSWFINHEYFTPPDTDMERDIDIIMVAGWAKFKRHEHFFKVLKKLKDNGHTLKVALVGYPTDMTLEEIKELAVYFCVEDLITFYQWIDPIEVAALYKRAKVNILWSKFEGNNRAIIEGMFCGTPVILREGHNYGEKYSYINNQTGMFANEHNLDTAILEIISNFKKYQPRSYVMENRNSILATDLMSKALKSYEYSVGRQWTVDLAVKTNELHGMNYLAPGQREQFSKFHKQLTKYIKEDSK